MFRCEGDDRLIDKIIKQAEQNEKMIADSEKKLAQIQQSPKSRALGGRGGKSVNDNSYLHASPRGGD
jgi:hypothetical protein